MKKIILFMAPVKTRSGYGDHARDLAYSIIKKGSENYDLQIIPTRWGNTPWTGLDLSLERDRLVAQCIVESPPPTPPDIFMQLTIPNEFQAVGKYNIGITAGIETDLCAPDWIEGINRMDMVISTSKHSLEVFKQSKYDVHDTETQNFVKSLTLDPKVQMEVLFEGLDLEIYDRSKSDSSDALYKKISSIKEDFAFLFVGHWLSGKLGEDRKDVGMLIRTFAKAFVNKPASKKPCLILKTSMGSSSIPEKYELEKRITTILDDIKNPPSIYLLHGDLSIDEMNILYHHPKVKAMVSFTKGEGFGRPLLEFGITGKPIIASNWSGQLDFLNSNNSILLPGSLTEVDESAVNQWILKDAKWFTVDYDYAAKVLEAVHAQYPQYLKISQAQSDYVRNNFSLERMSDQFIQLLDNVKVSIPVSLSIPSASKSADKPFNIQFPKLKKIE